MKSNFHFAFKFKLQVQSLNFLLHTFIPYEGGVGKSEYLIGAVMAATFSMSEIILLLFIINFSFSLFYHCTASSNYTWRPILSPFAERDFLYLKLVAGHSGHSKLNAGTHGRIFRRRSPRRPISTYYKHGFICM